MVGATRICCHLGAICVHHTTTYHIIMSPHAKPHNKSVPLNLLRVRSSHLHFGLSWCGKLQRPPQSIGVFPHGAPFVPIASPWYQLSYRANWLAAWGCSRRPIYWVSSVIGASPNDDLMNGDLQHVDQPSAHHGRQMGCSSGVGVGVACKSAGFIYNDVLRNW